MLFIVDDVQRADIGLSQVLKTASATLEKSAEVSSAFFGTLLLGQSACGARARRIHSELLRAKLGPLRRGKKLKGRKSPSEDRSCRRV